jgi:ATP synthase F1 complex assembly factor 1
MSTMTLLPRAGPSRLPRINRFVAIRPLCTTPLIRNVMAELDKRLNPREVIEEKRKAFEEKYAEKLKRRIER